MVSENWCSICHIPRHSEGLFAPCGLWKTLHAVGNVSRRACRDPCELFLQSQVLSHEDMVNGMTNNLIHEKPETNPEINPEIKPKVKPKIKTENKTKTKTKTETKRTRCFDVSPRRNYLVRRQEGANKVKKSKSTVERTCNMRSRFRLAVWLRYIDATDQYWIENLQGPGAKF